MYSTITLGHNPAFLPVELSKPRTPGLHTSYPTRDEVTGGVPSPMESAFPHASLQPPVLSECPRGPGCPCTSCSWGDIASLGQLESPYHPRAGGSESSSLWVPPPFLSPACLSETPVEEGDTESTPACPQGPPTAALWTPFSAGAGTEGTGAGTGCPLALAGISCLLLLLPFRQVSW